MNYQIEGPKYKPLILFQEDEIQAGLKHYPYDQITSIEITYEPSILSAGIATCVVGGKKVNLSFARSSEETMKKAVKELRKLIAQRESEQEVFLKTAEDMMGFCTKRDFKAILTRRKTIADFRVVAEQIEEGECVHYCFMGHYRKLDQTGRELISDSGIIAFAVTNKRIVAGYMDHKAKQHYSIPLSEDVVIRKEKDLLFSVLIVEDYRVMNRIVFDTQISSEVYEAVLKNF